MTETGRALCRLAASGLWYECDFEQDQHLADGAFVLTWRLHWVTGWDGGVGVQDGSASDLHLVLLDETPGLAIDGELDPAT